MVGELHVFADQGVEIGHLALTAMTARVHEHIANNAIGPLPVFLDFRDVLVQVSKDIFDILAVLWIDAFVLLFD